jgi:hypothetical protein
MGKIFYGATDLNTAYFVHQKLEPSKTGRFLYYLVNQLLFGYRTNWPDEIFIGQKLKELENFWVSRLASLCNDIYIRKV